MKVVGKQYIDEFCDAHSDARAQMSAWLYEAEESTWQTPIDIKNRYASASFLSDNRVIFNVKGNRYRIDTKVSYKNQVVIIIRVGTHAEYSKWKF